jgi:hypothetical protein
MFSLLKKAFVDILSQVCRDYYHSIGVYVPHSSRLNGKVLVVVLYYTEGVDPDVFITKNPSQLYSMLKGSR